MTGSSGRVNRTLSTFADLPEAQPSQRYTAQPTGWHDLAAVWSFETSLYGADNVDLNTLRTWWLRYSGSAMHVVDANDQVVGTFDAMPLDRAAFDDILEGRLSEADLDLRSIRHPQDQQSIDCWLITSLAIHPAVRGHCGVLGALYAGMLERVCTLLTDDRAGALCAIALSTDGEKVLSRLGFSMYRQGSSTCFGKPTYLLRLDTPDQLRALRARLASAIVATTTACSPGSSRTRSNSGSISCSA